MYPLSEEHRWYIISELKKGSINVRQTARFLNCHINTVSTQFRQWCEEHDIELCDWPGYSADFNAIELVWNIIKQEVKAKNPKS